MVTKTESGVNRFEHIYQTKYIQISCLIMSMCSSGRRLFETWFLGDLTSNCLSFCGAWWGKMYSLWTSRVCVKPYSGVQHPAYCKRVLVGCCAVERALDIWIEPGAASTVLPNNTPPTKIAHQQVIHKSGQLGVSPLLGTFRMSSTFPSFPTKPRTGWPGSTVRSAMETEACRAQR